MNGFLSWWDGVELWLSGLGFVLQTIVVMPVVLILAYLIALALDTMLGRGIVVMRRVRQPSDGPVFPRKQAVPPPRAGVPQRASSPGGDEESR
ncbi:hypothetical protein A5707_04955 [Mycobacterium kyorinense]|uniref:Uncharacterized protein n=1 Tax=Mycobacterium kyorinense TaxID=487514 RepID=A0A1A2YZ67_9MYCO|nr:hypothetical protein A5707_04955 [Mycobacterium kyorinense]